MGFRLESQGSIVPVNAALVAANETEISALYKLALPIDNAEVALMFTANIAIDAAATALEFFLYRGPIAAGVIIADMEITGFAAGEELIKTIVWYDSPGVVGELEYHMTAAAAAAVGNSSIANACLVAFVL
jgi:hypothetical protein